MENILSGVKPTGQLTLGNYIGALRNFPKYQNGEDQPYIITHAILSRST